MGRLNVGPMKTKSFWIPVSVMVVAGLLLVSIGEPKSTIGYFLLIEAALFALAFLFSARFGGPGSVTLGAALGFGLAITSSVTLGEDCEDSFFLCLTPEAAFGLGMVLALVLSPGWLIGARLGVLKRRRIKRGEQSPR